jgi:hypothetical protein
VFSDHITITSAAYVAHHHGRVTPAPAAGDVSAGSFEPDDAAVTRRLHHRGMRSEPDEPGAARVGALVLRVWLEGTPDDPLPRIGFTGRLDVTSDVTETASASSIEDAVDFVRDWLVLFRQQQPPR